MGSALTEKTSVSVSFPLPDTAFESVRMAAGTGTNAIDGATADDASTLKVRGGRVSRQSRVGLNFGTDLAR